MRADRLVATLLFLQSRGRVTASEVAAELEVSVKTAGDSLRLGVGTLEATLEHWQYDTFRVRWDNRWRGTSLVTFVLGPDGNPSRIEMGRQTFGRAERGR